MSPRYFKFLPIMILAAVIASGCLQRMGSNGMGAVSEDAEDTSLFNPDSFVSDSTVDSTTDEPGENSAAPTGGVSAPGVEIIGQTGDVPDSGGVADSGMIGPGVGMGMSGPSTGVIVLGGGMTGVSEDVLEQPQQTQTPHQEVANTPPERPVEMEGPAPSVKRDVEVKVYKKKDPKELPKSSETYGPQQKPGRPSKESKKQASGYQIKLPLSKGQQTKSSKHSPIDGVLFK